MIYQYSDGDTVTLESEQLPELLADNQAYLQNYLDIFDDLDDPSFVARGNGFCDTKYSEDFIDSQIAKYQQRIQDIKSWIEQKK